MNPRVESGLYEKYTRFLGAAQASRKRDLEAFSAGYGHGKIELDTDRLRNLKDLAGLPLHSAADIRKAVNLAASSLPEQIWNTLVVQGENQTVRSRIEGLLNTVGLEIGGKSRFQSYLAELGMTAVSVPPLPGILDQLAAMDGVKLLGDGDRFVDGVHPLLEEETLLGPSEALLSCMVADRSSWPRVETNRDRIRVAVIDSGIDVSHPCLQGQVEQSIDLSQNGLGPIDPAGHGTHVAGIIAGLARKDRPGWAGVAPLAALTDIQLWDPAGTTSLMIIAGIGCAVRLGVDVLNLSMGTEAFPCNGLSLECAAVEEAVSRGIIACIAAGNSGDAGSISVPGDAPGAITVAAVDCQGQPAAFSSSGPTEDPELTGVKPTLAAPGKGIISLRSQYSCHPPHDQQGLYVQLSGTSMATPLVTGICALGLQVLRGKGVRSSIPWVIYRALCRVAVNPQQASRHRVGAGVPQADVFFRELDRLVKKRPGASSSEMHFESDRHAQEQAESFGHLEPMPQEGPASHVEAAGQTITPEAVNRQYGALDLKAVSRFRDLETQFLQGVRSNLEQFGPDLVAELIKKKGIGLGQVREKDEENRIQDLAAIHAFPPQLLKVLPRNQELQVNFQKKQNKPLLRVRAKSFAAWQALEQTDSSLPAFTAGTVSAYVQAERDQAGKTPCLLVLFAPRGWPEGYAAMSSNSARVYWCRPDQLDGKANWFAFRGADTGWFIWLALHPQSLAQRQEQFLEYLLRQDELGVADGSLPAASIAERAGLPLEVTKRLLKLISCEDDRFQLISAEKDIFYLQRVKMRR